MQQAGCKFLRFIHILYVFERLCCLLGYNVPHGPSLILKEKTMDESSIKENLVKAREACALSQTEVALRLGINRASFIKLEKGKTHILNKHIPDLAEMYGLSLEALILGFEPVENSTFITEDFQKKQQQMVSYYENERKTANEKIQAMEERIAELKQHIRLLEEVKLRNERDLEKLSGV